MSQTQPEMTFTATGDSFITRRLPAGDPDQARIRALLERAQVRFNNLEMTVHRFEDNDQVFPFAFSGGTWAGAPPQVLEDLKGYGFNLINWANNHTMDYAYGGLAETARHLDAFGFVRAGAGASLREATAPAYLDCPGGRVALVGATSSFHESWMAGDSRPDCPGRPGVSFLRCVEEFVLPPRDFEQMKVVACQTGINRSREQMIREGFALPDPEGRLVFGSHTFVRGEPGQKPGRVTRPHPKDAQRILEAVAEGCRQADYVLVSLHSHQLGQGRKDCPDGFLVDFAHQCIDAGAHAVIGHGPHILRGVEVYRERPIFYSLGNFIFQSETVPVLPRDFYEKYGLEGDGYPGQALRRRSRDGQVGLACDPQVWESVIPLWRMREGRLTELTFTPIQLGFGRPPYAMGWPRTGEDPAVLHRLAQLSQAFGTSIQVEGLTARWTAE